MRSESQASAMLLHLIAKFQPLSLQAITFKNIFCLFNIHCTQCSSFSHFCLVLFHLFIISCKQHELIVFFRIYRILWRGKKNLKSIKKKYIKKKDFLFIFLSQLKILNFPAKLFSPLIQTFRLK